MRVRTIKALAAGMMSATLSCNWDQAGAADVANTGPRPNVVLIMADDMGWGDVAYNGHERVQTPHLDAMAQAGLRFNRFYAPTVCSPTRGSCLTGRHPNRYGVFTANRGHLPVEEVTLAEVLKPLGYRTGHFGKWHLGTLTRTEQDSNRGGPKHAEHYAPPWENGFEVTFSTEAKVPTWDPMIRPRESSGPWWDPIVDLNQSVPYGTAYWVNGNRVNEPLRGDDSRIIMDRALPFIQEAVQSGRPFLAVIWFHAPHLPVVAGPAYARLYPGASAYAQHYWGCITALDEQIGRLRSELRRLGVANNTLVWFCSDNGPEGQAGQAPGSTGPLRGRKRDLWEGGIRVPALLEWPAVVSGARTVDVPCVTSDFFPTILDFLGVPLPEISPYDGTSLRPVLEGRQEKRVEPIGFEFRNMAAWLENRYKLVLVLGDEEKRFLFDIQADPGEQNDLSAEQPDRVASMRAALNQWRESCRKSWRSQMAGAARVD